MPTQYVDSYNTMTLTCHTLGQTAEDIVFITSDPVPHKVHENCVRNTFYSHFMMNRSHTPAAADIGIRIYAEWRVLVSKSMRQP